MSSTLSLSRAVLRWETVEPATLNDRSLAALDGLLSLQTNSAHFSVMPDLTDAGTPIDLKNLPISGHEDDELDFDWQQST
jgi:hypothetical protein